MRLAAVEITEGFDKVKKYTLIALFFFLEWRETAVGRNFRGMTI